MTKARRLWLPVLMVAIIVCTTVSCSRNERPAAAERKPTPMDVQVRLKWLYFSNYSGAVVAKAQGFFPDHWDVNIRTGGFEADSIKMVASGTDDFGITSAIELIQARLKGVPIVALCADFQKSPVSFLTLEDSGITKVQQFAGRKVGIKHGTNTELIYRALLQAAGIAGTQTTEVPVKFSTLPLLDKQVDVFPSYYMTDPVNIMAQGVDINCINPDEYGLVIYGNVLFTTEKMLRENPEVVRDFVAAYVRGWQWAVEHPQGTGEIFANLNEKVPAENQVQILQRTVPYLTVDGSMSSFGHMEASKWRETASVLSLDPDADKDAIEAIEVESLFTTSYLPAGAK